MGVFLFDLFYLRGEARRGIASNNIKTSRRFPSLEMEQKRRV